MTVAALTPSKDYIENGSTTVFAVPFRFASPTHVKARRIATDGTVTELAYGPDYSVTGGTTDAGGTLTTAAPAAAGVRLSIWRDTPRDQTMEYETNDTFPAKSHENVVDKLTLVTQELDVTAQDTRDRAPLVPVGQSAPPLSLAGLIDGDLLEYRGGELRKKDLSADAGKFVGLDSQGRLIGVSGPIGTVAAIASNIAIDGGGNSQQVADAIAIDFPEISGKSFGVGITQLLAGDRGAAMLIDATGESLEVDQEGETWSNSNAAARQWKLGAPSIVRRLPTYQLPAIGTATQNRQMLNRAIQYLQAEGGVELHLVKDVIELDGPLIPTGRVSVIGPGSKDCLLKNTGTYDFRKSAIIQPGNFHPDATTALFTSPDTHSLSAITSGDLGVTLATPGDVSNYAVGDQVVVFDSVNYLASPSPERRISRYLALATILRVDSATLYLDRPVRDTIAAPLIHNLTTTTATGFDPFTNAQTQKLFAVKDATYAGFSIQTEGQWIADSATQNCLFEDVRLLRTRTGFYGNTFQFTDFRNIRGMFGRFVSELSHNSECVTIDDFDLTFDPGMGVDTGLIYYLLSWQENGLDCTIKNGTIDLGSFALNVPAFRILDHTRSSMHNVRIRGSGAFPNTVLTLGDPSPSAGKRTSEGLAAKAIRWRGSCGRYIRLIGSNTQRAIIEDCEFYGTPAVMGVSIEDTTYRNVIRNNHFDEGRLDLASAVSNQEVRANYIGGGLQDLVGAAYGPLINNAVYDNSSAKTQGRRKATTMLAAQSAAFTGTTAEQTILSADIGVGAIERQDVVEVMIRASITGTNGDKSFSLKVNDLAGPTERSALTWTVASGTTGVVVLTGTLTVTSPTLMIAEGLQQVGTSAATPTNGSITVDYASLDTQLELALTLASGSDSVTIAAARMSLRNEYLK